MINLKRLIPIGFLISTALVLSACDLLGGANNQTSSTSGSQQKTQEQTEQGQQSSTESVDSTTISVTESGFSPSEITVASGGTVTFVNNTSSKVQIASDPHPTHTANKEISDGQFVLDIGSGESATSALTKIGTWGFHDHLNPGMRGKVIVK